MIARTVSGSGFRYAGGATDRQTLSELNYEQLIELVLALAAGLPT